MGIEKPKNKRALLGALYFFLYLTLVVLSFASPAQHALNQVQNAGTTSSLIAADINSERQVIVPKLIDQFIKSADAKTATIITKNRAQITTALNDLLKNPDFKKVLVTTFNPLGAALIAGDSSVSLDSQPLANLLAHEVNSRAGETVISTKDLKSISKSQTVNISGAGKGIHTAHSILSNVIYLWILITILLALILWLRRNFAFSVLWKIFLSLGIPILVLWIVVPKIALHEIQKQASSELASSLFPILYRQVSGFTRNLAVGYLLLALIFVILARVKSSSKELPAA
ncbi:MAG: hypothetical protein WCO08_00695 [Actinomycetes bacterium]